MCVCMYIYIYICIYVCIMCMYVYIYIERDIYIHGYCVYIYIYIYIYIIQWFQGGAAETEAGELARTGAQNRRGIFVLLIVLAVQGCIACMSLSVLLACFFFMCSGTGARTGGIWITRICLTRLHPYNHEPTLICIHQYCPKSYPSLSFSIHISLYI